MIDSIYIGAAASGDRGDRKGKHEKKAKSLEVFGVARVATPFTDSTLGGTPIAGTLA